MAEGIKPVRRVVTGNDAQGRSRVLYDSAAPRVNANTFRRHWHDRHLTFGPVGPISG
jgi:hypothetical protein